MLLFQKIIFNYFFMFCYIETLERLRNDFRVNKNETDVKKIEEVLDY